ncbi:type II toxin-antitoxin system RelE/ParE family toxin [Cupriavidus agavae]|uniref:Proteic killer suppression protein n=1 Tax=Cupriavidus agavae TaxID=1001822 RepID=A0A4Q7RDQ5_9BURK|nr:type II toxin-antitoxin system RelE/ParE family toxin [Cupriavidus agavae]RZT31301.1 proteic killer suppression protein [Cupriavidus agavae]
MIRTLANKTTAAVFCGHFVYTLPIPIQQAARRKLDMLDAAASLTDLLASPANGLEPMRGRHRGRWHVRIDPDWHVCFRYLNEGAWNVEIAPCEEDQ